MHGVHGNEISSSDAALAEAYHLLAAQRRSRRRARAPRFDRRHRSDAEPGRPGALHRQQPARRGVVAGFEPAGRRTRRAVAGRPLEPLPVRHEPRLVLAVAAGNARPDRRDAGLVPARRRRPARDGRRLELLLRAAGAPDQPARHAGADRVVRSVRAGERGEVRRARLRLLRARELRRVLSGLRRIVADLPRGDRHDLRAGVAPRPPVEAERRRSAVVSRRHRPPLHRRVDDRRDGRTAPGAAASAQFLEYRRSAVSEGERGSVREYVIVPGHDPVARAPAGAHRSRRRGSRCGAPTSRSGWARGRSMPARTSVSNAQPAGRLAEKPARPPHGAGRSVHQGAGSAPADAPRGRDLRHHRVEPAARLRRRDRHERVGRRGPCDPRRRRNPRSPAAPLPPARVGYLLPWGSATAAAVAEALRAGIRIRHAGRPFTLAGRRYPMGTAIVRVSDNGTRSGREARSDPGAPRSRSRPGRQRLSGLRHLARQRERRGAEGAASAARVG